MPLPQRPTPRKNRIGMAVGLSLLAHALALPFVARDAVFHVPKAVKRQVVSLIATPRSQVQHVEAGPRADSPTVGYSQPQTTPQLPKPLEAEPHQQELIDGQVVAVGPPTDERAPEKPTKYLSERDSRVLKETRAKQTSAFYKNALSKVQKEGKNQKAEEKRSAPMPIPGEDGQGGGAAPDRAKQAMELPNRDRRDALHVQQAPDGTVQNRNATDATRGGGKRVAVADPGATGRPSNQAPGVPGLAPGASGQRGPLKLTLDNPMGAVGPVSGGPMPDELTGVEEGEETLLNTRSFKYAAFINRMKEAIGKAWTQRVNDESNKRDPTGNLYLYRDRRTSVEFTLDLSGEISDVHVTSSSGVPFLDDVAMEAFHVVQRVPNPPPGLLGANGKVKLPFSFTLFAAQGGAKLGFSPAYLPGSPAARGF